MFRRGLYLCFFLLGSQNIFADDLADILVAAENNNAQAQMVLGGMYEAGIGVARNNDKCAYWWQRASDNGHVNATKALGSMYFSGRGVPKDYKKAMELYLKAAENNHPHAIKYVVVGYERGLGLPQDKAKANAWSARAKELAGPDADVVFLESYQSRETEVNTDAEIFVEFQRQAEKGNTRAYFYMAVAYISGVGTPQDYKEAIKWMRKAAATNLSSGISDLAILLQLGQATPINRIEAQKLHYMLEAQKTDEEPFMSIINAKYMSANEIQEARKLADDWIASSL
ncbi:MAG: tetratricopeptide repeat protein [Pseudomonadota bacterium]|nr:tetratricopeptide repeat protein [Pseudomonadota bacterium]